MRGKLTLIHFNIYTGTEISKNVLWE